MLNEVQRLMRTRNISPVVIGNGGPKKLKALSILEEGVVFMKKAIETNPLSRDEILKEIEQYEEAIKQLKELK